MALLWTYTEQQTIKAISANQPEALFDKLGEEVQVEDLQNMLGFKFYQDIVQNPDSTANAALLDGGTYTVSAVTYFYLGLKYVLAYLFYAKYVKNSFKKDTYGGFVGKQFEESRQLNNGDEANFHKEARKVAFKYWEECEQFIKANSSDYPYYCTDTDDKCCWDSSGYNKSWCF